MPGLASVILSQEENRPDSARFFQANVIAFDSTGLTLLCEYGQLTNVTYLTSYTPQVNDVVLLTNFSGLLIVLGKLKQLDSSE